MIWQIVLTLSDCFCTQNSQNLYKICTDFGCSGYSDVNLRLLHEDVLLIIVEINENKICCEKNVFAK